MVEPKIQVRERDDSPLKCPWCLELISASEDSDSAWTCQHDGTICHRDCAAQFGKCPQCSRPVVAATSKTSLARRLATRELVRFEPTDTISNAEAIRACYPTASVREFISRVEAQKPGIFIRWLLCFITLPILIVVAKKILLFEYPGIEYLIHPPMAWGVIAFYIASKLREVEVANLRIELNAEVSSGGLRAPSHPGNPPNDRTDLKLLLEYEYANNAVQRWVESPVESRSQIEAHRVVNRVLALKWEIERRYGVGQSSPQDPSGPEFRSPELASGDPRPDQAPDGA